MEADGKEWRYNSALLVDRERQPGRPGTTRSTSSRSASTCRSAKTLPFLQAVHALRRATTVASRARQWTRFPLPADDRTYHFACLICYEDTDATLARHYVRPGEPGVDFLVNISNDGWFDGTAEHEQHLAICRFRAVETRRSVVRAVNMGISAIIDPDGRVVALPGETWAEVEEGARRSSAGRCRSTPRTTLYARLGDWLPVVGWAVILGGFVRGFVRPPPSPPRLSARPKRFVRRWAILLGGGYLVVCLVMWLLENRLVFYPVAGGPGVERRRRTPRSRTSTITSPDGHGRSTRWWLPAEPDAPVLLLFPGNAGNLSGRGPDAGPDRATGSDTSVLIFDYPGYGKSEGKPNEPNCYDAAEGAIRWLRDEKGSRVRSA